jgi:broad specificity phosphatase PhoE
LALSDAARDRVHAAPPGIRPGGGESIDDVRRRVGALLREHLDAARGRATRGIVLVTHGQTIRAALSWLRTAGDARFPPTVPANGSITTVYLTDGRVTAHHTVVPALDPGLDTGTTVTDGVDAGGGVW